MGSTVMEDNLQRNSRSNELRDEILREPRRSEEKRMPEPEKRADSGLQRSQVV